jgi:uncharacterized protein (TIGR02145 family)
MQSWSGCGDYLTPVAPDYTLVGTMTDSRDNKTYQVRKFADGKCWMVENLRYGGTTTSSGTTEYCKGKTGSYTKGVSDGTKNTAWYGKVGTNATSTGTPDTLYGDCRDPATIDTAPCTSGSTACGYLYNWQAALQLASAYFGDGSQDVTYPNNTPPSTTNHLQGICPTGWHLPSGGTTATASEFFTLDVAYGGDGSGYDPDTSYTGFWKPDSTTSNGSNGFNGLYSGYVNYNGSFNDQGSTGWWWSSSEYPLVSVAYDLGVSTSYVHPQSANSKNYGGAVRCLKD